MKTENRAGSFDSAVVAGRAVAIALLSALILASGDPRASFARQASRPGLDGVDASIDEPRLMHAGPAFYPRMAELDDGMLLVTFDRPIPGGAAIECIRSIDGARTWSPARRIVGDSGRVDVANGFPLALADGLILVAYRHHSLDRRIFRINICLSRDQGDTWEPPITVVTGSRGLWEPFLFQPSKGVIHLYYASEEGIYPDQRIEMLTSRDGGSSWSQPVTVARQSGSRDGMPAVVRTRDGDLLACFEASDAPPHRFVIRTVRSRDEGATWSAERTLVYAPVNQPRGRWAAGAPYLLALPDGRLLVSFQTDEDVVYRRNDRRADPALDAYDYTRHVALKLVTSPDQGRSWTRTPLKLAGGADQPAPWGGLCQWGDGRSAALFGRAGQVWMRELQPSSATKPAE